MGIDINSKVKIHNRFDIEVKDTNTGKIVQRGQAENIVLNSMFGNDGIFGNSVLHSTTHFGQGIGTLNIARTTLFSPLGNKSNVLIERVYNAPPVKSYVKYKIAIPPAEQIGKILTEVGIGVNANLTTHALIKDSEGNNISIGPKTEHQEITIYSTVYVDVSYPEGLDYLCYNKNMLLKFLLGESARSSLTTGVYIDVYDNKTPTNPDIKYYGSSNYLASPFVVNDLVNRKMSTGKVRFGSNEANLKIWSLALGSNYGELLRMLFPSVIWPGYHFVGKAIDVGNGTTKTFNLPWSDINTSKEYAIYVDGVLKTKDVDYTLSNSVSVTSITFITAPANALAITGDWWVDYIPKDTGNVLDLTFTITYGEGA